MDIDISRTNKVEAKDTYKKDVYVGKDIIKDVEYIKLGHFTLFKKEKTFKDKLEDFWFVVTTPFWKTKHWIKKTYWKIRYGFQRMFNDYDSVDTFEIFDKFIDRYSKILVELRNNHHGYPAEMTEEEWNNVLDEMIYHLYYMKEDNVIEALMDGVPEGWVVNHKIAYKIMEKHKNEFFKLFSEYFFSLWD